jgi:D-alanyl-D-alanine dipeptidase
MLKRSIALMMLLAPLAQAADFQVYQPGSALELAIDRDAIWREKDGVHFVNQERFAKQQHEKGYAVDYYIRRTEGLADCAKFQYVFLASYYFDRDGGHVWSALYPLPRHLWTWQPVYQGSVADKMLSLVCELGRSAPNKTINRP